MDTHVKNSTSCSTKNIGYGPWRVAIARCHLPSQKDFARYGGKGLTVCPEWRHSFQQFLADVGERPSRLHQLARIDKNQGYSKANCKWLTRVENGLIRRSQLRREAEKRGLQYQTYKRLVDCGWIPPVQK